MFRCPRGWRHRRRPGSHPRRRCGPSIRRGRRAARSSKAGPWAPGRRSHPGTGRTSAGRPAWPASQRSGRSALARWHPGTRREAPPGGLQRIAVAKRFAFPLEQGVHPAGIRRSAPSSDCISFGSRSPAMPAPNHAQRHRRPRTEANPARPTTEAVTGRWLTRLGHSVSSRRTGRSTRRVRRAPPARG